MKKHTILTVLSTAILLLLLLTAMVPQTAASGGPNLALNKPTSVSSADGSYPGSNAVDGDAGTYWRTVFKSGLSEEWIKVDLGGVFSIDQVVLNWNSYYATSYTVQVSEDDSNWTTVYSTASGDGGVDTVDFGAASARYVMLHSTAWSQKFQRCWLNEFEVYEAGVEPTPTPTHTPEPGVKEWTWMVYMVGDNDLESYVQKDTESELDYSNEDINVVILADRHPQYDPKRGNWTQTLLFYAYPGITVYPENALEDWGERNMGDPQTLIDFVQWTKAHYPANRYVLVLWNHGWMWRPYQSWWDETDDDTLDLHEIEAVMDVVGPVDVVALDACEQMALENMTMWRHYATAAAGSEDDTGMDAIEYEDVLPVLQTNPAMSNDELAIRLAESQNDYTSSSVTLGTAMDNLVVAVDELAVALLDALPTHRAEIETAAQRSFGMEDPTNKDLYDAAREIKAQVSDPTVQAKAQAVMDAVDVAVTHSHYVDPKGWWGYEDNIYGITLWWPRSVSELDEPSSPQWNDFDYYRNYLEFSQVTHWDEFLDAFVNQ